MTPVQQAISVALSRIQVAQADVEVGSNMTTEQQAISVALRCIQVARTDIEVCKVVRMLAYALGATRAEVGTIKALHAVLLQMTRPGMSDMEAFTSTKASKTNFVLWKRKVLTHARGV